jgi:hypothetical protein
MVEALRAQGTSVRSSVFRGADHFAANLLLDEPGNAWIGAVSEMVNAR